MQEDTRLVRQAENPRTFSLNSFMSASVNRHLLRRCFETRLGNYRCPLLRRIWGKICEVESLARTHDRRRINLATALRLSRRNPDVLFAAQETQQWNMGINVLRLHALTSSESVSLCGLCSLSRALHY